MLAGFRGPGPALRRLLGQAGVKPPYLLGAHSFGGLHANLFARLHPSDVADVVFVEATAPEDVGSMKEHQANAQRLVSGLLKLLVKHDPNGEVQHKTQTVEEIRAAPPFPEVPVVVLSGGKLPPGWMSSPQARVLRDQHQFALARLSPCAERVAAPGSGHFQPLSEPGLVIDAVQRLLALQHTG